MTKLLAILGVAIMAATLSFGANAQMMKGGAWQKTLANSPVATADVRTTSGDRVVGWLMSGVNPLFTLAHSAAQTGWIDYSFPNGTGSGTGASRLVKVVYGYDAGGGSYQTASWTQTCQTSSVFVWAAKGHFESEHGINICDCPISGNRCQ
jgi:hypothetical protein